MSFIMDADYENAKKKALWLLEKYNIDEPIIPVFEITQRLGLDIKYFKSQGDLSKVSGFLDVKNRVIYVNAEDAPHRQMFTVAHELGHFILEHESSEVLYRFSTPIDKDPVEQEANCFAANLLVPEKMLKAIMKKCRLVKTDLDLLSKLFGVSTVVIKFRFKNGFN